MKLEDALFNWLQIKLVADKHPYDKAALETAAFFLDMLKEDHSVNSVVLAGEDDTMVVVEYEAAGHTRKQWFDREAAYRLLSDIDSEPKYLQ